MNFIIFLLSIFTANLHIMLSLITQRFKTTVFRVTVMRAKRRRIALKLGLTFSSKPINRVTENRLTVQKHSKFLFEVMTLQSSAKMLFQSSGGGKRHDPRHVTVMCLNGLRKLRNIVAYVKFRKWYIKDIRKNSLLPEIILWFEKDFEQTASFVNGLSLELKDMFQKILIYVNLSICN